MSWRLLTSEPYRGGWAEMKPYCSGGIVSIGAILILKVIGRDDQVSDEVFWSIAVVTAIIATHLWNVLQNILKKRPELSLWQRLTIGAVFAVFCFWIFLFGRVGSSLTSNGNPMNIDNKPEESANTETEGIVINHGRMACSEAVDGLDGRLVVSRYGCTTLFSVIDAHRDYIWDSVQLNLHKPFTFNIDNTTYRLVFLKDLLRRTDTIVVNVIRLQN